MQPLRDYMIVADKNCGLALLTRKDNPKWRCQF